MTDSIPPALTTDERTFTCASCHETFECAWSDEEAKAEYADAFPDEIEHRFPVVEVCDECYEKFMEWLPTAEWPEYG